jgi:ribosomal protein L15
MSVIARALTALRPRALLPMRGFISVLQPSCSTLAPLGMPFRALSTSTAELPPVSFRLNTLRDLDGSWQHVRAWCCAIIMLFALIFRCLPQEKRVGRGKGSGYGKNSGRGQKGQRRKGGVRLGFEGGQTPVYRRVPKMYFLRKSRFPSALQPLNLGKLQLWLDMGRLDASKTITMKHILDSGIVGKFSTGVKVLARVRAPPVAAAQLLLLPAASWPGVPKRVVFGDCEQQCARAKKH